MPVRVRPSAPKDANQSRLRAAFFVSGILLIQNFLVLLINAVNLEQAVLAACELTTEYIDKIDSVYIFGLKYIMLSIGCIVFFQ